MFSSAFLVACFAIVAYGKPVARSLQVHETRVEVPSAFALKGPAAPDSMLDLRVALVNSDIAGLEKALMDVSTPGNALYGQHLTKEEVRCYHPASSRNSEPLTNTCIHRWRASLRQSRRPSTLCWLG